VNSEKRAFLRKHILVEHVPISVSTQVEERLSSLDLCAALIKRWASVDGIRQRETDAANALFEAAQAASSGALQAETNDVDTEMECEVEKEQEQEVELELSAQAHFERTKTDVALWRWKDLERHPNHAFYPLSKLQLPRPTVEAGGESAAGGGPHNLVSLAFPDSVELSKNVVAPQAFGIRNDRLGERRMPQVRCWLEWYDVAGSPRSVGLSLAEAQAMRVALLQGGQGGGVHIALRVLDSGSMLACTPQCPRTVPSAELDAQQTLLRFFNNDSWFSEAELQVLLEQLHHVEPKARHAFFHAAMALRRRKASLEATVNKLFPKLVGHSDKASSEATVNK